MSHAPRPTDDPSTLLGRLYAAGIAAADPYAAVVRKLRAGSLGARVRVIAAGKAARPMSLAALDVLAEAGRSPSGGVVVAPDGMAGRLGPLHVVVGDHPVPGKGSLAAGDAVGLAAALVRPGDDVLVLLSGGATSLMAAPIEGIGAGSLVALFETLLGSGAPIGTMNALRKRALRWGAGRLALALRGARVTCLIASDVLGDELASIGSGPCVPDPLSAPDLMALAEGAGVWSSLPVEVRALIHATAIGELPETPKPGDGAFDLVQSTVVLNNAVALAGIAAAARSLGVEPVMVAPAPLEGEARSAGGAVARAAVSWRARVDHSLGVACAVWGGETTVRLGAGPHGTGGRCQELALACARALDGQPGVSVLAAGTDGRDGPTDAAGAIVDGGTWARIAAAGLDPERAIDEHDSHRALDAAGALLRPGLTGTNVNDVVIALIDGHESEERGGDDTDTSGRR